MKFTTNTKPLADSLNLGIINSNVSNFYKKSCVVQISADKSTLRINVEAANICTELRLKGSGELAEGETHAMVFVDSLLFKQLINTLDSSTVTLEFVEGGLTVHSGKSTFTLPKQVDGTEFELKAPVAPEQAAEAVDIDKTAWKFIKDNQMYAISMAFVYPVYTKVWIGESGDVLVGNFSTGHFTHSKKGKLGTTCLLTETIINLFNSLPDGAKLAKVDRDYLIELSADSYTYITQFSPLYESDEGVGNYSADMILGAMKLPESSVQIPTAAVTKLLNQALLFSTSGEDVITLSVKDKTLYLKDKSVDGQIPGTGNDTVNFTRDFNLAALKQVIGNYADETVSISPSMREDIVTGIIVWNKELTTIIAGVE